MYRVLGILVFIVANMLFVQQSGNPPKGVKPTFAMTISVDQETVSPGSKVIVEIHLTNISPKALTFSRWGGNGPDYDYKIDIRNGQGELAPFTVAYQAMLNGKDLPFGSQRTYHIDSGETWVERVDVTKQYDLTTSGKYTIQAHRLDRDSNIDVKSSNTITLTVSE